MTEICTVMFDRYYIKNIFDRYFKVMDNGTFFHRIIRLFV